MLALIHLIAVQLRSGTTGRADIGRVTVHQLGAREGIGAEEVDTIAYEQVIVCLP
jgi:hypothetical protein